MSELKSLMEAEQELSDIFSKNKGKNSEVGSHQFPWSPEKIITNDEENG
jgi:hypothetical protein